VAIATALAEALHERRCYTLFATHYFELTALALPRLKNLHVAAKEEEGGLVFYHQVLPGPASKSYGVEVAEMAGLPKEVVERAAGLVRRHMDRLPEERKALRRFFLRRQDLLPDLVYLMAADRLATRGVEREAWEVLGRYEEVLKDPLPQRPLLSGEEVMALLGLQEGPEVGRALKALLEAQAEGRVGTKEEARAFLLYWRGGREAQASGTPDHPH